MAEPYRMGIWGIAQVFVGKLHGEDFLVDKTGCKIIEIAPADFLADSDSIVGDVNWDYVNRELQWYESMSLSVNTFPGGAPPMWHKVADKQGVIVSNYGWMVFSPSNYEQYMHVRDELRANPQSRRATMIYTRPSMWYDYRYNGRSDFSCTHAHTYHIRNNALQVTVNMRSNDAWAGYRNDYQWALHVQKKLALELEVDVGPIFWHADSLHFYERQFYLVDHFGKTTEKHISRERYDELYPDSPWRSNVQT